MKKTILISLFILTFVLSGCRQLEIPDPTSDWLTYQNPKYNYEIKVPTGSKINEHNDYKSIQINNSSTEYYGQWSFQTLENPESLNLNEFITDRYGPEKCINSTEETTLANLPAIKIDYECTMNGRSIIIVAEHQNLFYEVESLDTNNLKTFEEVLATFKFTKY